MLKTQMQEKQVAVLNVKKQTKKGSSKKIVKMERELQDLQVAVHGVTQSRTRLSDLTFTFHFHALEKEMTTHSNVLAWRIPGMGEPGGLLSMGSHRVEHD